MRTNDPHPVPFSRGWRLRSFLCEWRAVLIWTPCIVASLLGITLFQIKTGTAYSEYGVSETGTAKVVFVRHDSGEKSGDSVLVGLEMDGVTVLARTRTHVMPGEQVHVTYRYLARSFQYEVEQVEPAAGG